MICYLAWALMFALFIPWAAMIFCGTMLGNEGNISQWLEAGRKMRNK